MSLDLAQIREHFPALSLRDQGRPRIYLDNPGGTQLPEEVLARVQKFLVHTYPGHPGDGSYPTTLEAAAILQRVQAGSEQATPKTVFEPGELVRVIDGPFNDFNGVVEEVDYDKSRLKVAVLIFGRSTPVELEFHQVEKA